MKRITKLLVLCMAAALLLTGCMMGDKTTGGTHVRNAQNQLGLKGIYLYGFNVMYMGDALTAFAMPLYRSREDPTNLRLLALEKLEEVPGWHVEPVEAARVTEIMKACCPEATLFPAEDSRFEAWYFRQGKEYPETLPSKLAEGDWTLGFFDVDAGLWLHMDSEAAHGPVDDLPLAEIGIEGMEVGSYAAIRQEGPISITSLILPEGVRSSLLNSKMGWEKGEQTHREIVRMLNGTQEEAWPQIYPAADMVFDQWMLVDDRSEAPLSYEWRAYAYPEALKEKGISYTRDWLLALYDRETGQLVIYEYKE